jgi:hypothetical protein
MTYHIADEPVESSLRAYVVRPSAPLLAAMLCGAWLAWPWFAFNAIAMGSPTRKKELAMCAAAFAGTGALAAIVIALVDHKIIESDLAIRLAVLAIVTFKLTMSYAISTVQNRTFHVYAYYGGPIRESRPVLGVGYVLRGVVIGMIDHPLWVIIVAGGIAAGLCRGVLGGVLGGVL